MIYYYTSAPRVQLGVKWAHRDIYIHFIIILLYRYTPIVLNVNNSKTIVPIFIFDFCFLGNS